MRKFVFSFIMPAIMAGAAYRFRYKLLNTILGNQMLRRIGINAAMNMPGIRSRLINSAFRK
ncbi:hypothetical protein [Lederbergia citrea]|uniref:hypothetical protein n=1 Tax=Lederbergia citrea TaxID=2833581 RepID=UPI001BC9C25E|nr:hypothetical protein [Lederbergia citrea]MBS4176341.1 hypothetical protein [Lederbergia citrea]